MNKWDSKKTKDDGTCMDFEDSFFRLSKMRLIPGPGEIPHKCPFHLRKAVLYTHYPPGDVL